MRIDFINRQSSDTLICFHGFMGSRNDFAQLSGMYNLLLVSIPGHDGTEVIPLDEFSQILIIALSDHGIDNYHMLGYSMGGRVCLQLLSLYKFKPKSVIIESASLISDSDERLERDLALAVKLKSLVSDNDIRSFLDEWNSLDIFIGLKESKGYESFINERVKNDFDLMADSLLEFSVAKQDLINLRVDCPLLFIYGENDYKYAAYKDQFKKQFKAEVCIISDCSHNAHFMNFSKFNTVVNSFIERFF